MWIWHTNRGEMTRYGVFIASGFSGWLFGRNCTLYDHDKKYGALPRGSYVILPIRSSERLGKFALPLIPLSNVNTYGRRDFAIRGISLHVNPEDAAHGIHVDVEIRKIIAVSGDNLLEVVW